MLSTNVKRVLLDTRWPLPPTFLLPWAASLTTVSHTTESTIPPPLLMDQPKAGSNTTSENAPSRAGRPTSVPRFIESTPPLPPPGSQSSPLALSSSIRELLPLLKAQSPHYVTIHLHGKPYLVTQGDTIRLPFLMHGVEPGDVLRLNKAINIGSRDYTMKAAAAPPKLKSPTHDSRTIIDPTTGPLASFSRVMPEPSSNPDRAVVAAHNSVTRAPHFIPHIEQGKHGYLDERMFVCRGVVMGVESEPMRIKEKTKRRQRKVKKVKSKHRFTILRIKELRIKDEEEMESVDELD